MSEIIKRKIKIIKCDYKFLILAGIFYLSGIIIGIVCYKTRRGDGVFFRQVYNYYNRIFDCGVSPISTFFIRLAVNAGYFAIIFALSINIYTYPLILLIVAYRGAIIGCVVGIFLSVYGFNGGAIFFFVIAPQNLIVTCGIVLAALFNFDYTVKCKKQNFALIFQNCLLGFTVAAIGAIYELLISVILIRPMNF